MEKLQNDFNRDTVSIVKGIGILFVVCGHMVSGHTSLGHWISSFHVPLFFFITGFCTTYNTSICRFFKKKIVNYLFPYLYFGLILFILYFIIKGFYGNLVFFSRYFFNYGAMWFLPSLLISVLLVRLLFKNSIRVKILFSIFLLIVSVILNKNCIHLFMNLESVPISCFYVMLGHLFRSLCLPSKIFPLKNLYSSFRKSDILYSIFFLFFSCLFAFSYSLEFSLLRNDVADNIILKIVASMMGIGFVIFLSRILVNIEHARFLVRYGENTIVVMAYHYFIIECYCSLFFEIKKYFVAYKFLEFILVLLLIDLLVRYSTYIGIPAGMKNKIMKLS